MSTKRSEKQKKRKRKRNQIKQYKNSTGLLPDNIPKIGPPPNPYANAEEAEEDIDIMWLALQKHYGEVVRNDFVPPFMDEQSEEMKVAEWFGTYRDLLLEKYRSMELVEPRVKFNFYTLFYENIMK